jgi:3-oxoacyl-[acyl-carrier-protein] synthase-1
MENQYLYIAGIGMVSPVGGNTEMTSVAIKAGISAYELSDFETESGEAIKMALVPDEIINEIEFETQLTLAEGDRYKARHDRINIMACMAIQEACHGISSDKSVPLLMAKSEYGYDQAELSSLTENIANNIDLWQIGDISRSIYTGRSAGLEAISMVFDYLYQAPHDYYIVGGSDSYFDHDFIKEMSSNKRLLHRSNPDGFAPGESAAYLVLTTEPSLALKKNGYIMALSPPGIDDEPGHLNSDLPYKGQGLDSAFKKALVNADNHSVNIIYSSMNGEHFWSKELGVAQMRSSAIFSQQVEVIHPAENIGDIGAATSSMLIALAAEQLWQDEQSISSLVYASADNAKRAAMVINKVLVS